MANIPGRNTRSVTKGREARVWMWDGEPTPLNTPVLQQCLIPGSVSYSRPVTSVKHKMPSMVSSDRFDTLEQYNVTGRPIVSTSVRSRLPAEAASLALELSKKGCDFTMAWAYSCGNQADVFEGADRLEVFDRCRAGSYNHGEAGSFSSTVDSGSVIESIDITASDMRDHAGYSLSSLHSLDSEYHVLADITVYSDVSCDRENCEDDRIIGVQWQSSSSTAAASPYSLVLTVTTELETRSFSVLDTGGDPVQTNDNQPAFRWQSTAVYTLGNRCIVVDSINIKIYEIDIADLMGTGGDAQAFIETTVPDQRNINDSAMVGRDIYLTGDNADTRASSWIYSVGGSYIEIEDQGDPGSRGIDISEAADGGYSIITVDESGGSVTRMTVFSYDPEALSAEWRRQPPNGTLDLAAISYRTNEDSMYVFSDGSSSPLADAAIWYTEDQGSAWFEISNVDSASFSEIYVQKPFMFFAQKNADGELILRASTDMLATNREVARAFVPDQLLASPASTVNAFKAVEHNSDIIVQHPQGYLVLTQGE